MVEGGEFILLEIVNRFFFGGVNDKIILSANFEQK